MKKVLSVLMCTALLLAVLCACSNGEKKNENAESSLKFTYDSAYSSYDESVISAYESLCKCVINYESDLRLNVGMYDEVLQLFHTSFPLSVLVETITEKEDGSGLANQK